MNRIAGPLDKRIRRIAALMDVGVLLLSGDKQLDFASVRAEELLGLKADDEMRWQELLQQLEDSIEQTWNDREDGRLVELNWPGEDQVRQLTFQIHFLDEDECEGYLIIVRNRSLQRALETDLALAAQQRNLNRLYLGIAHDLRSPLNGIVLNLELLKNSLGEGGGVSEQNQRRARWLSVVEEETKRLGVALDALLSQTVEPVSTRTRFDLGLLLRDLASLLGGQVQQQRVRLRVDAPEDGPLVEGRRDRIMRALLNLAVNGLEACPEGGCLTLTAMEQGPSAVVLVSDTGPGVSDAASDKLFQLHFTTKADGTGLGLYVARSALEAEGGKLALLASSESGATFEVRLPLVQTG